MITTGTPVREVATELPQSTRLFEALKIDYCCGGNKPLSEACASAGVDVNTVMEMLSKVTPFENTETTDLRSATLPQLITHTFSTLITCSQSRSWKDSKHSRRK